MSAFCVHPSHHQPVHSTTIGFSALPQCLPLFHIHTHSRLIMAFANSIRTYSEKRLIGYTREQLFEVVATVENYHLFVPACRSSNVIHGSHKEKQLSARLEIGIPPLIESYTSHVRLHRPTLITANCVEGQLFKHLDTRWSFKEPPKQYSSKEICLLDFYVSFEFKSLLYAKLASPIFDEMVRRNVSAFLKRAKQLYGPANQISPHHTLHNGTITPPPH